MLKFIKHNMATIEGIEIYPLISLCIFSVFFLFLLIWVFRADKKMIKEISEYPLQK